MVFLLLLFMFTFFIEKEIVISDFCLRVFVTRSKYSNSINNNFNYLCFNLYFLLSSLFVQREMKEANLMQRVF